MLIGRRLPPAVKKARTTSLGWGIMKAFKNSRNFRCNQSKSKSKSKPGKESRAHHIRCCRSKGSSSPIHRLGNGSNSSNASLKTSLSRPSSCSVCSVFLQSDRSSIFRILAITFRPN
jgi:hypothetical protein